MSTLDFLLHLSFGAPRNRVAFKQSLPSCTRNEIIIASQLSSHRLSLRPLELLSQQTDTNNISLANNQVLGGI